MIDLPGPFNEEQIAVVMNNIVQALVAVHGCGILHRDIKVGIDVTF